MKQGLGRPKAIDLLDVRRTLGPLIDPKGIPYSLWWKNTFDPRGQEHRFDFSVNTIKVVSGDLKGLKQQQI